jgi:hypothetical protein
MSQLANRSLTSGGMSGTATAPASTPDLSQLATATLMTLPTVRILKFPSTYSTVLV